MRASRFSIKLPKSVIYDLVSQQANELTKAEVFLLECIQELANVAELRDDLGTPPQLIGPDDVWLAGDLTYSGRHKISKD